MPSGPTHLHNSHNARRLGVAVVEEGSVTQPHALQHFLGLVVAHACAASGGQCCLRVRAWCAAGCLVDATRKNRTKQAGAPSHGSVCCGRAARSSMLNTSGSLFIRKNCCPRWPAPCAAAGAAAAAAAPPAPVVPPPPPPAAFRCRFAAGLCCTSFRFLSASAAGCLAAAAAAARRCKVGGRVVRSAETRKRCKQRPSSLPLHQTAAEASPLAPSREQRWGALDGSLQPGLGSGPQSWPTSKRV